LRFVYLLAAVTVAAAEDSALLSNQQAFEHYTRIIHLMQSTTAAVPGLARAGAPVIENTRQSLNTLRSAASPQDGHLHYDFLTNVRAYLALSEALPKPFPFPAEGRRQFTELREALERADSHFRALLDRKEFLLRDPDRDNLARYAEANARLGPPQANHARVVFLGDSITDGWRLNEYFPEKDYVNRGISGQITSQMLGRFPADVAAHKPAVVVVLAGTNDIARGIKLETIQTNLTMIADLADKHRIKPIFASILPVHDYNKDQNPAWEVTRRRPMESIRALNTWLETFCRQRNYLYLDYFTPMLDEKGLLKHDLALDGLHPNPTGYRVMALQVQAAIDKVLRPAPPAKSRRPKGEGK